MRIVRSVEEWTEVRDSLGGKRIGFVPTMGGLHEGHLSLMRRNRAENDVAVASVYLNETQFNDRNDLLTYPANFDDDVRLLEGAGIDYLFAPDYSVMYPDGYRYRVVETDFSKELCGATRPGHFDGVLTVVMKLLNIVRPRAAYFGEKDFQQLQLLRGMVRAFFMDVEIVPCPIVREGSGLAISSRNRRLSEEGMRTAPRLHEILIDGNPLDEKRRALEAAGFGIDYLTERDGRLYVAAFLEGVRLIDNVELKR